MSLTKKKINIWAIITAVSFIYLALCPYILNPIYNILLGNPFTVIIKNIFTSIINLGNIVNFIACLVVTVGIFTKFDKIAVAITSALFWLGSLIGLITGIINSIRYEYYRLEFISVISQLAHMFVYFLMFAVALWFAILFFTKKETPKFLKILIFVPIAILAIIFLTSFITNFFAFFANLFSGISIKFLLYSAFSVFARIFNTLVLLVGFTAVAVKLADIKKKPKNTVEISEDVVIENVVNE